MDDAWAAMIIVGLTNESVLPMRASLLGLASE
jgi:hypothetical protein